jgi:large subunit ribosomal protein L10e
MGLRPAKTCRNLGKIPWTRYSKKKPRKSFVKAMPHLSLLVYKMGASGKYDVQLDLVSAGDIQLRDNALESARQAANKYLEKKMLNQYQFNVLVYPHNVIRENKMIAGAGADRLQKGMRLSYGRPTDRAARVQSGSAIFRIITNSAKLPDIKEAYRRAKSKLSGHWKIIETKLGAPVAAA